jgi:hypothetical protein
MQRSVTFETKCWEDDWEFLLKTDRLATMVERSRFDFAKRSLFINNVSEPGKVAACAEKLVKAGVLTDFHLVRDHEAAALEFFGLSRASLASGYVYSVAELVSIYVCETEFLLHFSGDSMPSAPVPWIGLALERFDADARVKVANLTWNHNYAEALEEAFAFDDEFCVGYGFSDQMYLVRASDFRTPAVYREQHEASARYPAYGGELFEKRVDSWMRNHDFHRLTYRHGSYVHRNFPRGRIARAVELFLERTVPRRVLKRD